MISQFGVADKRCVRSHTDVVYRKTVNVKGWRESFLGAKIYFPFSFLISE